jgi:carbonic anhydrase
LFLLGGGALGAALSGGTVWYQGREAAPEERDDEENLSGREARERLEVGNARYVAGLPLHPDQSLLRRTGLAKGQHPFAAVLSCADSRVPPEVLFDQGLGDLFVVRSAGQVVDRAVMGSLQYGVEHLETPLLVVLGHSQCGAVKATVEAVRTKGKPSGTDIDALVEAITPAVHEAEEIGADEESLVSVSIDINVERIVESLKEAPLIGEGARMRTVKVVGAVYDLKSGHVDWL